MSNDRDAQAALAALLSPEAARRVYAFAHQVDPADLEDGDLEEVAEVHALLKRIAAEATSPAENTTDDDGGMVLLGHADPLATTPDYMTAGLELLAEAIGTKRGDWAYGGGDLTSNYGAEPFENDVFALRAFCWCDGEVHPGADCPPNFEHKPTGLRATWYKHARRSPRVNGVVGLETWRRIEADCLASLGITLADIDARREADLAQCLRCGKRRADFADHDVDSVRRSGACGSCREALYRELEREMLAAGEQDGVQSASG